MASVWMWDRQWLCQYEFSENFEGMARCTTFDVTGDGIIAIQSLSNWYTVW
jgi:hypothetical protein